MYAGNDEDNAMTYRFTYKDTINDSTKTYCKDNVEYRFTMSYLCTSTSTRMHDVCNVNPVFCVVDREASII